jgi:hypothetical protein
VSRIVAGDRVWLRSWEVFALVDQVLAGEVHPEVYRVRVLDRQLEPTKLALTVGPRDVIEWNDPPDDEDGDLT